MDIRSASEMQSCWLDKDSRGSKRQTAYPSVESFDSFLAEQALTAGSDFLFGPNYIAIRGYFE